MLAELASAGVMIVNWPEDCRHPGETPKESNKGISELVASEQTALMDALVHPSRGLYFRMNREKRKGTSASLIHVLSVMLMQNRHAIKQVPCYRWRCAPSVV
jgi:hypothetical protein